MNIFRIYFNKRKQWLDVTLWDVHPTTFSNWGGGRWGYFERSWENPRRGKFGELHFVKSRVREDVVSHEIFHVVCEWLFSKNVTLTRSNEESKATLFDELVRKFYREYRRP